MVRKLANLFTCSTARNTSNCAFLPGPLSFKMNEFNFHCDKCPRTFKLEEFYEKHKKVHELKKQHRCGICGFVYGAAKGLEGHLKTHTDIEVAAAEVLARGMAAANAAAAAAAAAQMAKQQQQAAL